MNTVVPRFAVGLLASLLVHAVLVGGGDALFSSAADSAKKDLSGEAAQLEITQVDLSFAEEENESAAPQVAQPAAVEQEPPQPPPPQTAAPEPPPLTVPEEPDSVLVRKVDDVRPTDLRPREPDAPEMPPLETEQRPEEKMAETKPQPAAVPTPAPSEPVAAVAPTQARVDAPPSPRRSIKPKYPDGARKRGEQGDVTLELSVDAHGVVVDVKVVASCGFAELEQAAIAAARKALFRPAKQGDESVASLARLTLSFKLRD